MLFQSGFSSKFFLFEKRFSKCISSVISQNGESQNRCFRKTKHAKFSEKPTHTYVWYNTPFEIHPFHLLPTVCEVGFILFTSIRVPYNVALFSLFKEIIWCFYIKNLFPRNRKSLSDWAMENFSFLIELNSVLSPSHIFNFLIVLKEPTYKVYSFNR